MTMKTTTENMTLRLEAVRLTRLHFWPMLGMMAMMIAAFVALDMGAARLTASMTPDEAMLVVLLIGVILQPLCYGFQAEALVAAGGGTPRVGGLFPYFRHVLKIVGLHLWIGIKIALWALPGFLVAMEAVTLKNFGLQQYIPWLVMAALAVMLALVIPAALRYSLASWVLSQDPSCGVFACVRESKNLTKGRKWQLFRLQIPIFWNSVGVYCGLAFLLLLLFAMATAPYAASLGKAELEALVTPAATVITLISMLPMVYFLMQSCLVSALFFLRRQEEEREFAASSGKEGRVSYWLQDQPRQPIAPPEEAAEAESAPAALDEAASPVDHENN